MPTDQPQPFPADAARPATQAHAKPLPAASLASDAADLHAGALAALYAAAPGLRARALGNFKLIGGGAADGSGDGLVVELLGRLGIRPHHFVVDDPGEALYQVMVAAHAPFLQHPFDYRIIAIRQRRS